MRRTNEPRGLPLIEVLFDEEQGRHVMAQQKSDRGDGRPKRGGSDTARKLGQVGIVIHLSKEDYRLLDLAAADVRLSKKEFAARATLAAIPAKIRKLPLD